MITFYDGLFAKTLEIMKETHDCVDILRVGGQESGVPGFRQVPGPADISHIFFDGSGSALFLLQKLLVVGDDIRCQNPGAHKSSLLKSFGGSYCNSATLKLLSQKLQIRPAAAVSVLHGVGRRSWCNHQVQLPAMKSLMLAEGIRYSLPTFTARRSPD